MSLKKRFVCSELYLRQPVAFWEQLHPLLEPEKTQKTSGMFEGDIHSHDGSIWPDFPEIRGFPFLNATIWGPRSGEVAII